jgi:hypothetical protein
VTNEKYEELAKSYASFVRGEGYANEDPKNLIRSYVLEAEFLMAAVDFLSSTLGQASSCSFPFENTEAEFLGSLTALQLRHFCNLYLNLKKEQIKDVIAVVSGNGSF